MIEKHTFVDLLNTLETFVNGNDSLQTALSTYFDENYLTETEAALTDILSNAFFEDIDAVEQYYIDTVYDLISFYAYTCDFNNNPNTSKYLYECVIINEGKPNEERLSIDDGDMLYDIIMRYLNNTTDDFTFLLSKYGRNI